MPMRLSHRSRTAAKNAETAIVSKTAIENPGPINRHVAGSRQIRPFNSRGFRRVEHGNHRLPPQNIEAERVALSAILSGSPQAHDVYTTIQADDFYREAHRGIYQAAVALQARSQPVDIVSVCNYLKDSGKLDEVGGPAYVCGITEEIPIHASHHATVVRDKARLRRLITEAQSVVEMCYDCTDPAETISAAEGRIMAATQSGESRAAEHLSVLVKRTMEETERRSVNPSPPGIPTGFIDIDRYIGGMEPSDLVLIAARPSMGKELTLCSDVLLCDGTFKKMGDIMVGDKVASVDGEKSVVIGVFPQGIKPVYAVRFADGRTVKAGLEHQWEIMYRDWERPKVVTTAWLIEKLKAKRYKNRLYIPGHSGDFGKDIGLTVNPYLLGVLLGDGGLSEPTVKLTTSHKHILEKIKPQLMGAGLVVDQKISFRLSTERGKANKLNDALKSLGLKGCRSYEKFIPSQYLSACKESRLELMRGLIDTDGTVEKTGAMTFTTTSIQMAEDFQKLARSLGAYASMSSRVTHYSYKGEKRQGRVAYTICVSCANYSDFVTIPHKKKRVVVKQKNKKMNVTAIDYIGDFECQCITVEHPRELYLTDGYTPTHNTAFAMNMIQRVAVDMGIPAQVFSLEMSKEQLSQRMLSSMSGVKSQAIRDGRVAEQEWPKIVKAVSRALSSHVMIDDTPGLTVMELRARARRTSHRMGGVGLIVVDYLQLMRGSAKNQGREREISEISGGLKNLAKELGVPVVALSQLNRDLEKRPNKRPVLADLRDSGSLEQDADIVGFIYRDEVYNTAPDNPNKGIAEFIIGKQRRGPTGTAKLAWLAATTTFEDLAWQT